MKMSYALCQGCSFILAKEIPDEDFLNLYYADSFSINSRATKIKPDFDVQKRLDLLVDFLKPPASILEFGANRGDFCRTLNKQGYVADGVDLLKSNGGECYCSK